MNLVMEAMNGGEDYELLFTVPLTDHDKVSKMRGVSIIGYVTKPELGAAMVTRDGGEIPIQAQGWNAFNEAQTVMTEEGQESDAEIESEH